MNSCDAYFINNKYFDSSHKDSHISIYGHLFTFDKPIYLIPVHVLSAVFICAWRDTPSCMPLIARRITCSIAVGGLALLGVVDCVIRLVVALFAAFLQQSTAEAKKILLSASLGISQACYFAFGFHINNFCQEKIIQHIIRT